MNMFLWCNNSSKSTVRGVVGVCKTCAEPRTKGLNLSQACVKSLEILSCWNWCQSQAGARNWGHGKLGRNIPQDSIWLGEDLSQWMSVTKNHTSRDAKLPVYACFYSHSSSRCLHTLNRILHIFPWVFFLHPRAILNCVFFLCWLKINPILRLQIRALILELGMVTNQTIINLKIVSRWHHSRKADGRLLPLLICGPGSN